MSSDPGALPTQSAGLALSAVQTYFDGERRELLSMVIGSVLLIAVTAVLLYLARDGFARGLCAAVVVFGTIVGGGGAWLLVRDVGLRSELAAKMTVEPGQPAVRVTLDEEKTRIADVLSMYGGYRIGALVIAVVAFCGLLFFRGSWVHGAAVGLLLVVAAQSVIDHYSERRAAVYQQRLTTLPVA